ncbi:MAG: hypothetical protein AAGA18_00955 [Verrucomicrobiota bacterium]
MQRQIRWKEKTQDGESREVRVTLFARQFKWQFKYKGSLNWDYNTLPTTEDWDNLVKKIEARYNRRRASIKDVELASKHRDLSLKKSVQ